MPQAYQKLGRYLLLSEIAKGGMATVYHAKLLGVEGFEKEVAIKKILPYWSHQKEFIDMLIDEAKILVPLHHNNIVQVFELGKENNSYYIVMEYVDGLDLKKILNKLKELKIKLPLDLACYIIKQICQGLDFAHTRLNKFGQPLGIVHRDISPQNILIDFEGNVKITDFGIAKVTGKKHETNTGVLKGKFSYMSPEQALGHSVDLRTDIFATGILLYEVIFGKKCFEGENDLSIIDKVKRANIHFPTNIPTTLHNILIKCLQKNLHARYQSASDLKNEIELFELSMNFNANSHELKKLLQIHCQDSVVQTEISEKTILEITKIYDHPTQVHMKTLVHDSTLRTYIDPITIVATQGLKLLQSKANQDKLKNPFAWILFSTLGSMILFLIWIIGSPLHRNSQLIAQHSLPKQIPRLDMTNNSVMLKNTRRESPDQKSLELGANDIMEEIKFSTINVQARPWGTATINDTNSQILPASFTIPTGEHIVNVYYPPLKKTLSQNITVEEGKDINCRATFGRTKRYLNCY